MHRHTHHRRKRNSLRALTKRVAELEDDEERKFKDVTTLPSNPQSSVAAAAAPTVLNVVLQNDSRSGRNGAKIDLSSIQLDFWYTPKSCLNASDLATMSCSPFGLLIRFICVWFPSVGVDAAPPCPQL